MRLPPTIESIPESRSWPHCTVHTIGIGPGHNALILRRLARDTGGIYKAVGTN